MIQSKLTKKEKTYSIKGFFENIFTSSWISITSLIVFLLIWEVICRFEIVSPHVLAPPSEIISMFIYKLSNENPDGATLFEHIKSSLTLALSGFSLAIVIGIPLGLIMGWYKLIDGLVRPLFDLIRPIPPIAWIPLAILWLGIGIPAKAFIIFLAAFVPCVLNSYTGIRLTDPILIRVASIYGASNWESFLKIGVPSAVPMIFVGLKVSLNSSWTTLVAAELLAAFSGLGYLIQIGRRISRPDIIIVGMLTIGLIGAILSIILNRIENSIASSRRF
jgi:ABC-type nitrate/sulfonate/bicarbonate transport system permease component